MIPPFPNFFTTFFHLFPANIHNYMNHKMLHGIFFFAGLDGTTGKTGGDRENPPETGKKSTRTRTGEREQPREKAVKKNTRTQHSPIKDTHERLWYGFDSYVIRLYLLYYTDIPRENTGNSTKRDKAEGCNCCCFQKLIYHGIAWMKTPSLYTEI